MCPECHPNENPCGACQAGGICDGAFGQGCRCWEEAEGERDWDLYLDEHDNDDFSA
jgi:hypothetical protein